MIMYCTFCKTCILSFFNYMLVELSEEEDILFCCCKTCMIPHCFVFLQTSFSKMKLISREVYVCVGLDKTLFLIWIEIQLFKCFIVVYTGLSFNNYD